MFMIAVLFAFLLGVSALGGILSFFYHVDSLPLMWQIWAGAACISLAGTVLSIVLMLRKKKPAEAKIEDDRLPQFEKEVKQVIRGHLKISILFWTFFYKKEKVKSFEDARREVFQDLRKEFPHVHWIDPMLDEIRQELSRYK